MTTADISARVWWPIADSWVVTLRNLRRATRIPEMVVFAAVQPVMLVLLLSYVFGNAIKMPETGSYRELLIPGIFTQTLALTSAVTAIGVADDLHKGLLDRFRSLPMARSAFLAGRTIADLLQNLVVLTIMSGCGLIVGWRIHDGLAKAVGGYALLLLFGYAMSWIGVWIGLSVRAPEAAQSAVFIWLYPLTFLSNAFVPVSSLPGFLAQVAQWNPVSPTVLAVRQLFGDPTGSGIGHQMSAFPLLHPALCSLGWSVFLLAVFVPLSVHKYKVKLSR